MKGLTLFKRMHSNGKPINSWIVASWHNPRSITWRWSISYSRKNPDKYGAHFFRVYRHVPGINFQAGINLPILGSISISTQPHMWDAQP